MASFKSPTSHWRIITNRKLRVSVYVLALFLSAFVFFPVTAQSSITFIATVDKTQLTTGEQLTLELILSGPFRNANKPDFPQLDDFYVMSNGQSSQFSMTNNQMSSRVVYSYRLQPLREGTLTIPSISIKVGQESYTTEPLSVKVTTGSVPAPQPVLPLESDELLPSAPGDLAGQNFYVEAEVDNDSPFVSQQIIYTFRLYQRVNFSRQPSLDWPEFIGFLAYDIAPNNQYNQTIGENKYLVTEVRRSLFPTSTGPVTLDPTIITVPGDLFNQGFLLQTDFVSIDVRSLPSGAPQEFSGAVGQFDIQAWVEPEAAIVNEPVSLFLRMEGIGNVSTLPDPTEDVLLDQSGWRVYDPQITTNTEQVGDLLSGEKVVERLLLPTDAGLLHIPSFPLTFFDPDIETYQQVETEPILVKVEEGEVEAPGAIIIGDGKQDIKVLGADIRHIKSAPPTLEVAQKPLIEEPLYWFGWVLPLCMVIGTLFWIRHRENLERDSVNTRRQRALSSARKQLRNLRKSDSDDAAYAGVAYTLTHYLGDKLALPPSSLTRDTIRRELQSQVSTELIDSLLTCLEWADSGRYAPAAKGRPADDLVLQSLNLISALDKVLE